ncbi:facilitated trehalose transporter Tret1-like [Atheta coriaria]|uniref:facilitated trehalose transporter Tret1-like n=2 Tax=Dalotia coriaria TaxID=877792 RepID=UPI0031F4725E
MIWNMFQNIRYMQYVTVCIATMTITSVSMYGAWPSPTLPILQGNDSPIGRPLTDEEGSWLASVVSLATPPSCLAVAWTIQKLGRKGSLMASSVLMLIPWIIIIFAQSPIVICAARVIGGLGFGCAYSATTMYSGEVADVDLRGKLGIITSIMKLLGSFIVLAVGPFISYTALSLVCMVVPLLSLVLISFMPESPYHLVAEGKTEEARDVLVTLATLNATPEYIDKKLLEIEDTVENDMQNQCTFREFISNEEYRQAFIISIGIKSLNQFSGVSAIDSYMQQIVASSGSSISPEYSSIIFGAVQIPAAFVAIFLVDKVGRKPLLIVSALGCAAAYAGEAAYFYLQNEAGSNVDAISWLPTTGIVVFLVMNNIGVTTVPVVVLSEIFPTNIKSIAIAVNTFYGSTLSFLVSKFFKPMSNAMGMHYTFLLYMICCVLGVFFVIFCVPETKGKTFTEIQLRLNKKYIKRRHKKMRKAHLKQAREMGIESSYPDFMKSTGAMTLGVV